MTCPHLGAVKRLTDDLANITDRNLLRRLVVMAAVRGGDGALRLVADEARREAQMKHAREQVAAARRRDDHEGAARWAGRLEQLEVG